MFEKGKKFVKRYKAEIIVGGCVMAAGIFIGYKLNGKINAREIEVGKSLRGREWIAWFPAKGIMSLEKAKSVLELNNDNHSMYAIYREGSDPDKYLCIVMDDLFVEPQIV